MRDIAALWLARWTPSREGPDRWKPSPGHVVSWGKSSSIPKSKYDQLVQHSGKPNEHLGETFDWLALKRIGNALVYAWHKNMISSGKSVSYTCLQTLLLQHELSPLHVFLPENNAMVTWGLIVSNWVQKNVCIPDKTKIEMKCISFRGVEKSLEENRVGQWCKPGGCATAKIQFFFPHSFKILCGLQLIIGYFILRSRKPNQFHSTRIHKNVCWKILFLVT